MNKEYIYLDGKVIVEDEKGNKKLTDYQDNIHKILVQENLIETMENRIKKLEKELENNKENNKPYIPYLVPAVILALIAAKIIIDPLLGNDTVIMVDTIFGTMNNTTLVIGIVGTLTLPLATIMEIFSYQRDKHHKKSRRADVAEYEYLQKQVETEREILEKLKKNKERNNESSGFKSFNVSDKGQLEALKSWLILYRNLGFDIERYCKLYQKGQLEETLTEEGYNDIAYNCAKEFVEEKGPTLTRKRIPPKNR